MEGSIIKRCLSQRQGALEFNHSVVVGLDCDFFSTGFYPGLMGFDHCRGLLGIGIEVVLDQKYWKRVIFSKGI